MLASRLRRFTVAGDGVGHVAPSDRAQYCRSALTIGAGESRGDGARRSSHQRHADAVQAQGDGVAVRDRRARSVLSAHHPAPDPAPARPKQERQTDLLGLCGLKHAQYKQVITDSSKNPGSPSPQLCAARSPAEAGLDGARTRMRMDLCRGRPYSSPVRRCPCSATDWRCLRCRCSSFR